MKFQIADYYYQRDGCGNIGGVTTKDRAKRVIGYTPAGEVATPRRLLTAQARTYLISRLSVRGPSGVGPK